ncbi:MAG: HNH endonuclease signature motif containing protein [Myxococcota bacterium]
MRRALHVRDGHCRFPGCSNRRWLDAHHIEHWADGGATSRENLLLLCTAHHRLVHEGGFRVERAAGDLVFLRPDGTALIAPRASADPLALDARPPRPPSSGAPNYHWAIGALVPRRVA